MAAAAQESTSGTVVGDRKDFDLARNVTYDMSGTDERFYNGASTNLHPYGVIVFQPNQLFTFPVPVYLRDHSGNIAIEIQRLVTSYDEKGNASGTEWETVEYGDSGWREVEEDAESMSQAYLMDTTGEWNATLTKQIQFFLLDVAGERITLRIFVHKFYMSLYEINGFDGVGPSYTPALGKWLLDKIEELETTSAQNIANTFGVTGTTDSMLPEDLTGVAPGNYVQDEMHTVDTSTGRDTLMPNRGSFYSHDFCLWQYQVRTGTVQLANKKYNLENQAIFIYSDTSNIGSTMNKTVTTKRVYLTEENYNDYIGMAGSFIDRAGLNLLVNGVDYELTNLNVPKTEMSQSEYGVYDTIRFLGALTGSVLISYHAFGGAVVFEDVQDMRKDVMNLLRIFSSKNLVTSDILAQQPVIKDIMSRLMVVEQYHNHFNQVEHAVYMGNKGYHWINIAQLYDVAWGEELTSTDEIGQFRVESLVRGWCYEFTLSVDLRQKLVNAWRCRTLGTNDVTSTDLKDYITYFEGRDDVGLRLCWVGDGTKSGVVLQLGWNYDHYTKPTNGVDTDTIVVTNKSGIISKWKLFYNPLDDTYEDLSSKQICNHTKYEPTTDTTYSSSTAYFKFEPLYSYYRTASATVQDNVQYYTIQNDALNETRQYVAVDLIPSEKISDHVSGVLTPACPNGVYERVLYKQVPRLMVKSVDYTAGETIADTSNVFVVSGNSYSEDSGFLMPSTQHTWTDGNASSHKLSRLLEPSDGLVAWVGCFALDQFNADSITVGSVLSLNASKVLDISSIKGMTIRLYDRKMNEVLTRNVDVGYTSAVYNPTADTTAVQGKYYYKRSGTGTNTDPYVYTYQVTSAGRTSVTGLYEMTQKEKIVGQVIFDLLDLCGAKVSVYKEINSFIKFSFDIFVGTDSGINKRYDVRQIELHF